MKRVVLIGLRADVVDYEKWPELSKEKLESAFQRVLEELTQSGYDAHWCLTDTGDTAEAQVTEALQKVNPDVVLVGAGVRTDPDHFLLFEKVINLIHQHAPNAAIAFNSLPFDSVEAVQRWS
uniref:hypothetical protein n=1 Tax=Microbulbifer agarilyticus TaxID=260552 RepID=UPI000255B68C|nr:hypothetical protein [Microbulbifer agarilyticus]